MKTCIYCGVVIIQSKNCIQNFCNNCSAERKKDQPFGIPYFSEKMYVKGYGDVSVARVKEMESQVMLPIERKDGKGDYYLGTKLTNGKLIERTPDFRP